ncbi:ATP-binding protein [Gorillibacterium sp. sgz5001074]|uniref:sensor histidine kinase n=1 Tax=Gorillibacterium sp. sgz5001074 TaxID=3446695 RepID=UPI003F662092
MSIRMRLVLSYIAMLVVPFVLFVLSLIILVVAFLGDIKEIKAYYHLEFEKGSIQGYFDEKAVAYAGLRNLAISDPARLADPDLLADYEKRLSALNIRMVIAGPDPDRIAYQSPGLELRNAKALERYDSSGMDHDRMMEFTHGGKHYTITHYELLQQGQVRGALYLLQDITPLQNLLVKLHPSLLISFVLALVLTNGALTYWVSRSIVRPVRLLREAAERMKEGNLDVPLAVRRKDELGQLSQTFEEMRVKLKESIELRLQVEENRKQLLSNIAHDIKTPITAIKGYVEGIIDGVANDPERLDKYVRTIYKKTNDLDKLIDELFLYSKLDLNSMPFHMENIDGMAFLLDCVEELKVDLEKRGIAFVFESSGPDGPFRMTADREKLKRAIMNIIENSCKYMDKEPAILSLRLIRSPQRAVVEILDNGAGIDPAALPYIFERFYRADKSRNSATGGSGLGLAITRQIVEAHGGTVAADSLQGHGTKIIVSLPVQELPEQRGGETDEADPNRGR